MSKICGICGADSAAYLCPRCNLPYCNSNCYKNLQKHGECSESFYQEQVMAELKSMSLNDTESRARIVDILKKEAKKMEESDEFLDTENQNENISSSPKEDDLVKHYLGEILNWKPWWRVSEYPTVSLITEIDGKKDNYLVHLNPKLVQNSQSVSVQNSSSFLYNQILKSLFIYQLCLYTYQLNLDDFASGKKNEKLDTSYLQEICTSYLEIEKLIDKLVAKGPDIKQQFEAILSILTGEQIYFLKAYTNKEFLINLIDELQFVQKRPRVMIKIISHLYDLFSLCAWQKELRDEKVGNLATNVFHFGERKKLSEIKNESARVKIIKSETKTDNGQSNAPKLSKGECKLFLKRLEYYFKWLEVHAEAIVNVEACDNVKNDLDIVKQSFRLEMEQFDQEKKLIDKNLDKIRPKIKLIEEI